jgi:hypothetical protein
MKIYAYMYISHPPPQVWNLVLGYMASTLSHKIHVSTYIVNYNFHPHFSLVETIL